MLLSDLLNSNPVLAHRTEVGQIQRSAVGEPVPIKQLVAASGRGLEPRTVDGHQYIWVSGVAGERVRAVDAADDDVITVVLRVFTGRGPFGPRQHIQEGEHVDAAGLLRGNLSHGFTPDNKKPALGRPGKICSCDLGGRPKRWQFG